MIFIIPEKPATPTANPPAGQYTAEGYFPIVFSTETKGAFIFYTTDGSPPSTSNGYASLSGIGISETTTITIKGVAFNGVYSDILTEVYNITILPLKPTANPPPGNYVSEQNITLSTTAYGASIRYTLNGEDPTPSSALYTAPITIYETCTLKAISVRDGDASNIYTADYTFPSPAPPSMPAANPPPGNYVPVQRISLSSSAGAAIHYTLNGADPTAGSDVYTAPIFIGETTTLKAIAVRNGAASNIYTAIYTFPETYSKRVKRVPFYGNTATVNIDSLAGNNIYLVKVNVSNSIVNAADTGSVTGISPSLFQGFSGSNALEDIPIIGHPAAFDYSKDSPPAVKEGSFRPLGAFIPPVVDDIREFWVETPHGSGSYTQKQATLRATGIHSNVWVLDENYTAGTGSGTQISSLQAQAISDKFDLIYPAETNILGFEYGGGPGGNGGLDSDPKIQILAYSIGSSVGGYFHTKDNTTTNQYSNKAEMFYISTNYVNSSPNLIYTVLIHEFQHMICYNRKWMTPTWYTEMLSAMAEDIIGPLVGIAPSNPDHVIRYRMPSFLTSYNQVGIAEWDSNNIASYGKGAAFGAYLLRNYGGAELLKAILDTSGSDISSLTNAVNSTASQGITFQQLISRFSEAMIFSGSSMPEGALSFDKTVTNTINSISYTVTGFDIWDDFTTQKGPYIFDLTQRQIRPYSLTVHSDNTWQNRTGAVSITLQKPANENVEFYLMVR